jgi:hypothetical protein
LKDWNEKLLVIGTGGQAGDFASDDPMSPISPSGAALRNGYATAAHNGGHVSWSTDALWSFHNESALLDYGFRAPHVAGLIARAVVRQSYRKSAKRVYFSGCSNGGREALQMAQHYPYDYDGIIAGAPSMRWSDLFVHLYWFTNRLYGDKAVLDGTALALLHRNALNQCDHLDGSLDNILDDPRKCKVDLARITCKADSKSQCLSPPQSKAAREIYEGPHDPAGQRVAQSSAMPGSELTWDDFSGIENYPLSVMRFQSFMPPAGPQFIPDETKIGEYLRRSGGSDAIISATNPDLRRFRDKGGKLLSFMGWNDPLGGVRETIDYYSTVERVIGNRKSTLEFYRLFMVPGMNHCSGGDGAHHPDNYGKPKFMRTVSYFEPEAAH